MGIFSLLQDLPNPGIKLRSPTFQAYSLPSEPPGKCFELAVSNIGWRLLNWNDMLCKGSALSKSYFLLQKRNVVELNDVYLNISFEWPYYPFSPALSWFWFYKTSLLEISILWCEYFWISIIGEDIWGKAQNWYGRQKKEGRSERHTVFSAKWIRHKLVDFHGCCCSFLPLIADAETMICGP